MVAALEMTPCFVFDIDGTLADLSHRLHLIQKEPKDWDAFFDACAADAPIHHMIQLCRTVMSWHQVVFVSGRAERCRSATEVWLGGFGILGLLYMRPDGDHRPDHVLKAELLDRMLADGLKPVMAFDDRNQVVKMWRERGIPCAQVADGDF